MCYLKLRSYREAETILRCGAAEHHTKRGADYQRSTTLEYARLALAQLGQSNVTDAANTGASVLATATDGVLSTRTLKVVGSLASGMTTYGRLPVVQSFLSNWKLSPNEMGTRAVTDELRLERYDEPNVDRIYVELVTLYAETHQDLAGNVFYTTDRFKDFLVSQRAQPGFDLVAAWAGNRLVGVAFGFSRPAKQQFQYCELMVTPDFQRQGIAKRLTDELLSQRPEPQAVLLVRKDNAKAQAAYKKWGWTKIGDVQPTLEAPNFDELSLALPIPSES